MTIKWDRITIKLFSLIIATTGYALTELIVGWFHNSSTLQADGYHMLADLASLIVALIGYIFASRPWSKSTYGWARSEILGALINSLLLFILAIEIVSSAFGNVITKEPAKIKEINLVFAIGLGGLIFNLVGFCLLYDINFTKIIFNCCTSGENVKPISEMTKTTELGLRGAALHLLADTFSSCLVLVSVAISASLDYDWIVYIDPLLSLIPATIILISGWRLLRESALILMQTLPSHIQLETIRKAIINLPLVHSVHEFHLWRLSEDVSIASLHCIFSTPADYIASIREIEHILCSNGVHSTTIQPEFIGIGPFTGPVDIQQPKSPEDSYIKYCRVVSESCEGRLCCTPKYANHAKP